MIFRSPEHRERGGMIQTMVSEEAKEMHRVSNPQIAKQESTINMFTLDLVPTI